MATYQVANRYPRQGERIAPLALREFLAEPIPKKFHKHLDDLELRYCDLDETVWQRMPADAISRLAKSVVDFVSTHRVLNAMRDHHFPRPMPGVRLDDLHLDNRTRRCLVREGLDEKLERLGDYTMSEILLFRSFGPRCLLDLLAAVESLRKKSAGGKSGDPKFSKLSKELTAEAEKIAAIKESRLIRHDDPRFGRLMQVIDSNARTAHELAEQIRTRKRNPTDVAYMLEQVRQLRQCIERMSQLTIEEELIQIYAGARSARNREILIGYYGWKDGQTHTLAEVGDRFGITRERVRQICAKLTRKRRDPGSLPAPVMDRVLAMIHKRIPFAAEKVEAEFMEQGLTAVGMTIEAVAVGGKLLKRPVGFKIVKVDENKSFAGGPKKKSKKTKIAVVEHQTDQGRKGFLAVRSDQVEVVPAIVDQVKKGIYFHGVTTTGEIERMVVRRNCGPVDAELIRQAIMLIDGFTWLDESAGWFTLQGIAKHGLPKVIDKALSVAEEVTVSELRVAFGRNRRMWIKPPPENVLLEYCRMMPNVHVDGKRVYSDPPRNWKKILTGVEAKMTAVLKKHGPLMDRVTMEEMCVGAGMNRFSFHAFLSWSPVITQFGPSVYGLLGAKATKQQLDKLLAVSRANRGVYKVLDNYGVTEDGNVWLRYRLSKAASTYAVITIPSALKKIVRGRFQLIGPEGKNIGALATKEGRAWGLGTYLRKCEAKFGDNLMLTIDLGKRMARVSWEKVEAGE